MLVDWGSGDEVALEKLTPLVYDELHRLARRYMSRERPGHMLQTSALVNEASYGSSTGRTSNGRTGHTSLLSAQSGAIGALH
jgi:ECF sigma factor